MTKIKFPKPDYKFWAKLETWSLHQAAMLLHGIDPHQHRSLRLTAKDIPIEFAKAQQTYALFRNIPWQDRHPGYYFIGVGVHPVVIIFEAKKKGLSVPKQLIKLIGKRFQQEQEEKKQHEELEKQHAAQHQQPSNKKETIQEQPLSSRERKNLLKAIGVLVKLLMDEKEKSIRGNRRTKISALQISQMMLDKAEYLGIEIEGLKSFDRKITEALDLLTEEVT